VSTVNQIERYAKRAGRVLTVSSRSSVSDAARMMRDHQVGSLVVVNEKGEVLGILTERDVINLVVASSRNPAGTPVQEVMTREVISCLPETTVTKAQRIMAQYGIRHLPIIEEGVAVGMISTRDVMAHQLSEAENLARRQSEILNDLESEYPGITKLRRDGSGRIVL